jgi:nuclear transport factor 2 (NTF2) superfamily protein
MDTREAAQRWRRTWEDGWQRGDVDAVASLYAPTCQYRALAFRQPDEGAAGARRYLHANFTAEEKVTCSFNEPVVGENRAAVEWWASWTEEGRTLTMAGVTLLRFDDEGLVLDQRDYWNDVDGRREPYPGW